MKRVLELGVAWGRAITLGAAAFALAAVSSCGGQGCGQDCGPRIERETLERCAVTDQDDKVIAAPAVTWATRASQPPVDAVLIELTPGAVSVERGEGVAPGELASKLEGAWTFGDAPAAGTWALAIAGDAPRADVAAVLKTLAELGHAKGYLLLGDGERVTKAEKMSSPYLDVIQEVDKVLSVAPAEERTALLRAEIEKRAPACLDLDEVTRVLLDDVVHRDCRRLAREVSQRLAKCGCPAQSGAVAALMSITSEAKLPGVSAPASIDPSATPRAGATWADIVAELGEAELGALWVDAG